MEKEEAAAIICVAYFAVMVLIGVITAKRNRVTSDYLVARRKPSVIMTTIILAVVQIGVGTVLSGATNGYGLGVWPGMYCAFGCGGGLVIIGPVTTEKLREQKNYVLPDYFAQRHGESKTTHLWARISSVSSLLGIFTVQLLASGGILADFRIPFKAGAVVTAVVILIYCTVGGMQGVVLTDMAQTAIIAVGAPILVVAILIRYVGAGGDIGEAFVAPSIPAGMGSRFMYLVLPFLLPISASYDAYSRIQSSKGAKTVRIGCIIGGILVIIIDGFRSTIGVATRSLLPGITGGIFTITATGALLPVLTGIVTVAIPATIMSSTNCVILSMGASFARGFYNKFLHPEVDNLDDLPKSKLTSQATVFVDSSASIFLALHMTDILDAVVIFNHLCMEGLLTPLLGELVWKRATRKGAFAAAIAGGIIGAVSFLFGIPGPPYGKTGTDLSLVIIYLISTAFLILFGMADRKVRNWFVHS